MGTEVAISFSTLRAQLENEKSSLFKIDENIKKIAQTTGRFSNDRINSTGEYPRGNNRAGGRNSFQDSGNSFNKIDEHFGKRKQETKTVFSRLSARTQDSDGEEEGSVPKRSRMPSAVSRELPTRAAVLRAQGGDEQARTRNRRIFGSLLGTLQKFKQEEIVLQTKEEKKAQVERKIEEQARMQKEKELKERKTLFTEREHKRATIKALEAKMARVQEFEKWEESQRNLGNFVLTRTKPHMYWIPKKMNDKAEEKLILSRKYHEKCMLNKRQELQEELQRIEQRCLRQRAPGAKENDPDTSLQDKHDNNGQDVHEERKVDDEERGRKRDKFAMDVEKDDSEDDHHDDAEVKKVEDKEVKKDAATATLQLEETKIDTSTEPSTAEQETDASTEPSTVKQEIVTFKELPTADEEIDTFKELPTADEEIDTFKETPITEQDIDTSTEPPSAMQEILPFLGEESDTAMVSIAPPVVTEVEDKSGEVEEAVDNVEHS